MAKWNPVSRPDVHCGGPPGARRLSEACFSASALAPCSGIGPNLLVAYGASTQWAGGRREKLRRLSSHTPLPVGIKEDFPRAVKGLKAAACGFCPFQKEVACESVAS